MKKVLEAAATVFTIIAGLVAVTAFFTGQSSLQNFFPAPKPTPTQVVPVSTPIGHTLPTQVVPVSTPIGYPPPMYVVPTSTLMPTAAASALTSTATASALMPTATASALTPTAPSFLRILP